MNDSELGGIRITHPGHHHQYSIKETMNQERIQPTTFCLTALMVGKDRSVPHLIAIGNNIADQVNTMLNTGCITVRYINVVNNDKDSPDYNPDGWIGRFEVFRSVPPCEPTTQQAQ